MKYLLPLFLLTTAFGLAGCDATLENDFEPEVVVESYQVVGEPLAPVYVLRNAPIGGTFDRAALAIEDASVEVHLLGDDGAVETIYAYRHVGSDRYVAAATGVAVLPLRRYRLSVRVPGEPDLVTSTTRTPGAFELVSASADTATYGVRGEELVFNVTRPAYPGRQAIFLFTTETLLDVITLDDAVPFVRAFVDQNGNGIPDAQEPGAEGDAFDLEDLRIGSSPLLNEKTYSLNADGTLRIELPWIAVPFYGPSRVSANAVDDNLYDFLRSQSVQQGGSSLSPGEIPNVLDRVENGAGLFGSYAKIGREVFILRPASDR